MTHGQPPHILSIVPCECGSHDAFWHGAEIGLRVYCCDRCWDARTPDLADVPFALQSEHQEKTQAQPDLFQRSTGTCTTLDHIYPPVRLGETRTLGSPCYCGQRQWGISQK